MNILSNIRLLPIPYRCDYSRKSWIVSVSNQLASSWLDNFDKIDSKITCVYGSKGGGKTHLAKIFANQTQAVSLQAQDCEKVPVCEMLNRYQDAKAFVIDDCENFDEEWLFDAFNIFVHRKVYVLLTTGQDLSVWHFRLKDLDSRIRSTHLIPISPPDEALIRQLIQKKCTDEGVRIEASVVEYLISRIPRNFNDILTWIQKINEASLIHNREITKPLIRELLTLTFD